MSFIKKFVYQLPWLLGIYHFLLAWLGTLVYKFPSREIFVIGVTGTKGKTTVLELMNSVLEASGKKVALLSSIKVKIGDRTQKNLSDTTMPGRFFIQRFLRRAVGAGCRYALLEVTSQGVVQHRHRFINWNAAFLVNFHPEHIEAHGTFQKYRGAKLSFLKYAARKKAKIFINKDDRNAEFFVKALRRVSPILYSRDDVPPSYLGEVPVPMASLGAVERAGFFLSEFNRENAAAAVALARHLGIGEDITRRAIQNFKGLPGRMEFVAHQPFGIVIDYAHTPESLIRVYQTLRSTKSQRPNSRLICVLGSAGGGRDKWKRPEFGKIAGRYCDFVILTNEDPYDENPEKIIKEIRSGIPSFKQGRTREIPDRREAIKNALWLAKKGDVVVLTGKGSESWIHTAGGEKIPWDEKKAIEEIREGKK